MLKADNIQFEYESKEVLKGVSLVLSQGERVGLIGPNGSGKTTILRILAGELSPIRGRVVRGNLLVGYLPQEPKKHLDLTLEDFIRETTGVAEAEREFELASHEAGDSPEALKRLSLAMEKVEHLGAYTFDSRLQKALKRVGFSERLRGQVVSTLSGGERKRVTLAAVLMSQYDVLLLDEPTNDLDLDGIAILEKFLLSTDSAVVIVTHDRRLLRTVTTRIAEVRPDGEGIDNYSLGYEEFLKAREARRQSVEDAYNRYLEEKKRLKEAAKRIAGQASRAETSRKTSDNEKMARHSTREKASTRLASSAKALESRETQLSEPERPLKEIDLSFMFEGGHGKIGDFLFETNDFQAELGKFQLGPISFTIERGDRIVLVGPNGSGKSSLLGVIFGKVSGVGQVRHGRGLRVGMMDQSKSLPNDAVSALENAKELAGITGSDASSLQNILHMFNFDQGKLLQKGKTLSPGERARMLLASLVARETNLLLLDEPTNHLDIPAIEELERALQTYPESFVVVSHDRDFIDSIRPTKILEVVNGRLVS